MRRFLLRVVFPLVCFAALASVWSFPLVLHLSSRLPGELAGDNLSFLWNLWWMRQAGTAFFFTDHLFAPFGVDLALHTHTALQGAVAATLLGRLDLVTAQNLIILATLTLNGFAAYLLALDRTRDTAGAMVAGLIFASTPYVAAHLLGHFSLISTWTLPLFVLCLLRALERRTPGWSLAAGACLAAVAFTDYYYAVYCLVMAAGLVVSGSGAVRFWCEPTQVPRRARATLGTLLVIVLVVAAVIAWTGGFDRTVLGVRVRATDTHNLFVAAWLLTVTFGWLRTKPRLRVNLRAAVPVVAKRVRALAPGAVVAAAAVAPLVLHVGRLAAAGDYSAPAHQWRSSPGGVDLAALLLGNPFHPLTGAWTSRVYTHLGLDRLEGMGWLGVVPMLALAWGVLQARRARRVDRTLLGGAVFFVWALGPWLKVAGIDTGLILPANLFGLIPLLSNARMPGRAIVVTVMAAALLAARLVASAPPRVRIRLASALAALLLIDTLSAPFPTIDLVTPHLYTTLAAQAGGTLLELPMGLRDGFEQIGAFDDRTLQYQMVHGHPLVGGFAARIPPSIKRRYDELPLVRSLLRLSSPSGGELDPRDARMSGPELAAALDAAGIRFVVLDRTRATPALQTFVDTRLPLTLIEREGTRVLFRVNGY